MGDTVGATVDLGVTERLLARDQEGTLAVARDDLLELVGDGEFGRGIHGQGGLDAPVHDRLGLFARDYHQIRRYLSFGGS